jgi:hypothetical protein
MRVSITLQFFGYVYLSLHERESCKNLCSITCILLYVQVYAAFVISQISVLKCLWLHKFSGSLAPLM